MNKTGSINATARTIDFDNETETDNIVTVSSSQVIISYKDAALQVIQLKKSISNPRNISIGDYITTSHFTNGGKGGYGVKSSNSTFNSTHVAKSLANVDPADLSNFDTSTFTDQNGNTKTVVKVPCILI